MKEKFFHTSVISLYRPTDIHERCPGKLSNFVSENVRKEETTEIEIE